MKELGERLGLWLDGIGYRFLIPTALLMGLAPFQPEPHLWETTRMLVRGELTEPIDIFDFVMHGSLLFVSGIKIGRDFVKKGANGIEKE